MKRSFTRALMVAILVYPVFDFAGAQWPLGREDVHSARPQESRDSIMVSGRFQVFVSPHAKGHTFMIDTETGRVWVLKKDGASGEFSFHRIAVDQVDGEKKEKPGQQ